MNYKNSFNFWFPNLGYAHIQSIVTIHPLPVHLVRLMLPPKLELMSQDITPEGTHPVIIQFNSINQERPLIEIFDLNYLLANISIPYVKSRMTSKKPLFFASRIFVTKKLPMIIGRIFFGLAKERVSIGLSKTDVIINGSKTNCPLLIGKFEAVDDIALPSQFPNFNKVIPKLFKQTAIGFSSLIPIYSNISFDLENSCIQPLKTEIKICRPFLLGLPTETFITPSILDSPLGAFKITTKLLVAFPQILYSLS